MINLQLTAEQVNDLYIRLNMSKLYRELETVLDEQPDDDETCLVTEFVKNIPMQDKIEAIQSYQVIRFY